jgi:hypothetical protein
MEFCKVQTIVDWVSIWDVQCFLGFVRFYWCFIAHYYTIKTPLTCLIQKDQPFSWGIEDENAFQSLQASFTTTPLLIHVNPSKPFVLETDVFDFALGAILL